MSTLSAPNVSAISVDASSSAGRSSGSRIARSRCSITSSRSSRPATSFGSTTADSIHGFGDVVGAVSEQGVGSITNVPNQHTSELHERDECTWCPTLHQRKAGRQREKYVGLHKGCSFAHFVPGTGKMCSFT